MLPERKQKLSRAVGTVAGVGVLGATLYFGAHSTLTRDYFQIISNVLDKKPTDMFGNVGNFFTHFAADIPHLGGAALIGLGSFALSTTADAILEKRLNRVGVHLENRQTENLMSDLTSAGDSLTERANHMGKLQQIAVNTGLTAAYAAILAGIVTVGPLCEEIIFRDGAANAFGYMQGSHDINLPLGILTSLVFGYAHNLDFPLPGRNNKEHKLIDFKSLPLAQLLMGGALWYSFTQFGLEGAILSHVATNLSVTATEAARPLFDKIKSIRK